MSGDDVRSALSVPYYGTRNAWMLLTQQGESMTAAILYLLSILAANLLVIWFGIVKLGPIMFPAGAVLIGLTFTFRDLVQRRFGKWKCWWWMAAATIITAFLSFDLAVASGLAFIAAEGVDWLIYSYSKTTFKNRVVLSNLFGTPIDSLVFVTLAFGWNWAAIWGQTLVKLVSSLAVVPLLKKQGHIVHDTERD